MHQKLLAMQKAVLPKSKVGEAVHYTLSLWNKLTLFLAYPALELSNNLAENSIFGIFSPNHLHAMPKN